jgi:hypothetical protein
MTSSTQQHAPALDVDARLSEIERGSPEVPGAEQRLAKLRAGVSVTDLYEGDVSG